MRAFQKVDVQVTWQRSNIRQVFSTSFRNLPLSQTFSTTPINSNRLDGNITDRIKSIIFDILLWFEDSQPIINQLTRTILKIDIFQFDANTSKIAQGRICQEAENWLPAKKTLNLFWWLLNNFSRRPICESKNQLIIRIVNAYQ